MWDASIDCCCEALWHVAAMPTCRGVDLLGPSNPTIVRRRECDLARRGLPNYINWLIC